MEHRALGFTYLCDESQKKGVEWEDFGCDAIKICGYYQGVNLIKKSNANNLKGLKKTLFTKPAQLVFEMEIV